MILLFAILISELNNNEINGQAKLRNTNSTEMRNNHVLCTNIRYVILKIPKEGILRILVVWFKIEIGCQLRCSQETID